MRKEKEESLKKKKKLKTKQNKKHTKIMAWKIGKKLEAVIDFLFLGSKITADGDYSHEIRKWLYLGRKAMTNLDSVLKRKDITLPTKIHIVKIIVSPVIT